jgi:type III restriction enzyme
MNLWVTPAGGKVWRWNYRHDGKQKVMTFPKSFYIPTPVGHYSPDWAIAFKAGTVRHIYFIAETKGSLSSLELRKIEGSKIDCARRFFAKITSDRVKYAFVTSYSKLMELVQ